MSVLGHVIASITAASATQAEGARRAVAPAGAEILERLAVRLGGAQHSARPRATRRTIVVVAGDHGVGDPGIALGADHPTVVTARAIADASAALTQVAGATPLLLVDAGAAEGTHMPGIAIGLGRGPSRDLRREPAMTIVDAALGIEAGIALAVSLAEEQRTLIAVGAIGVGSEVAAAALLGAALGGPVTGLGDADAEAAARQGAELATASGLERLAAFGGPETAVLAGLMLGLASMNIPVILDNHATGAAALIAVALAPALIGYLVAAHTGSPLHGQILAHLGLVPLFPVGLGHGEGTGAAMALPLADQVEALAAAR